ncbi:MAG: hypothetical protein LBD53_11320 [Tannerella sp.]|jgi:AraC-like DNA-binding protein|nr:hypothetical protein [Tannerella sp.]
MYYKLLNIVTNAVGEKMLRKATMHIEKNLDNEDYSVEDLGIELAMSRRTLLRKFNTACNMNPNERSNPEITGLQERQDLQVFI